MGEGVVPLSQLFSEDRCLPACGIWCRSKSKLVSSGFESGFIRSVLVLGGGLSSLSDSERLVTNFNEAVS